MSFVRRREHSLHYKDQCVVLLREVIAVYGKNQTKYTNTLCWKVRSFKRESRRCMYLLFCYFLSYYVKGLIPGHGCSREFFSLTPDCFFQASQSSNCVF